METHPFPLENNNKVPPSNTVLGHRLNFFIITSTYLNFDNQKIFFLQMKYEPNWLQNKAWLYDLTILIQQEI